MDLDFLIDIFVLNKFFNKRFNQKILQIKVVDLVKFYNF